MSGTGAIEAIRAELDKLDAALHRPLCAGKVGESLKRVERIQEHLVRVGTQLRQSCKHDGVLTDDGICLACNQDGLPVDQVTHRLREGFQ